MDELLMTEQKLSFRQKEVSEHCQAAKLYMQNSFNELRKRIDLKERELMLQCDDKAQNILADID